MPTRELQSATVSSSSPNRGQYRRGNISVHDDLLDIIRPSINHISRVRTISPPKVRASTPQHKRRFQVTNRKVQLQGNNSHRIVSHDKVRESRLCFGLLIFQKKINFNPNTFQAKKISISSFHTFGPNHLSRFWLKVKNSNQNNSIKSKTKTRIEKLYSNSFSDLPIYFNKLQ